MSHPRREYLEIQLGTKAWIWRELLRAERRPWWERAHRFWEALFSK